MAKIQIYGKTYSLKSSSDHVSMEEVAAYVDAKMRELAVVRSKTSSADLAVLAALNIAQELMELQEQTDANDKTHEEKIGRMIEALEGEIQAIER
ncbi:MAG: cell division protein ZapA [Nitrospinaceae bacterium]|nr:cell division protein ZapA [Nitrospinaceae bacterium]